MKFCVPGNRMLLFEERGIKFCRDSKEAKGKKNITVRENAHVSKKTLQTDDFVFTDTVRQIERVVQ